MSMIIYITRKFICTLAENLNAGKHFVEKIDFSPQKIEGSRYPLRPKLPLSSELKLRFKRDRK